MPDSNSTSNVASAFTALLDLARLDPLEYSTLIDVQTMEDAADKLRTIRRESEAASRAIAGLLDAAVAGSRNKPNAIADQSSAAEQALRFLGDVIGSCTAMEMRMRFVVADIS